jgi:hypothetical protein
VVARRVAATPARLVHRRFGTGRADFGRRVAGDLPTFVPAAVAVRPDGEIAVLDSVNNRVVRFAATGRHLGDVAVPVRSRDVTLADLAYDPAGRRLVVLDTLLSKTVTRQRLVFLDGGRVDGVLFDPPPAHRIGVTPDGTVQTVGEEPVALYRGGAVVPAAARTPLAGDPSGAGPATATVDGRGVRLTAGGRAASVRLPDRVLDTHVLPSDDGAVWLVANTLRGRDVRLLVVRVAGDLATATYFPVAFDLPGDVTRPVAVTADGVVVLTGAGDGMDLVAYRPRGA